MQNSELVEGRLQEIEVELGMMRNVLQMLGQELSDMGNTHRVFLGGHVIVYDGELDKYFLDFTVRLTFPELCGFLMLPSDSPYIQQILALRPVVATGLKLVK